MASSSRILSRIPNFQKSFEKDKKVDLAESAVFKNVNFGSEDQKLKYLESFRFINSAFPFFIKEEHHAMASSEMKEGQGEYWGHAIHFLLSNKAHGFPLWNEFEEQMRSVDASFSCKPHVSAKTTNSAFEHYFEKSANNFNNALDFLMQDSKSGFLKSSHKLKQLFDANRLDLIEDHERGILGETYILNYYTEFVEVFSEASSWIVNTFNISPKPFVDDFNGTFDDNLYPDFVQLPIEYVKKFVVELGKTREFLSSYSTLILRRTQVFSCDFQKRILDIVLNCIDTHLQIENFENEKDDVLRDWQVVQYLLPCFVASYLNICESEPPVDESFKKWYYNFIDNLIE
ncbi:Hypothetical predicted protein [Cloeon dipterum]|uniref:Uncharacterized protein n=1 Tax=Cloeon dipterum TaxID=197152 RepID=A0A8S1DH74_9INSE|nr:Hypothetical predicted protein [Cloeon dipterum]